MIKKLRGSLLSNEKPQDENVMWIDTSNPESFTLKLFRNGDWKPLHVVGTTRDMIERELTGYVTSHYHSYDKIINKPTTLTGYGITDCFNKTEIESLLNKKVTKVSGKSLSTNDFNNEYKKILDELPISYYNKNELDNLFNDKQDIITDLNNIREGAEKGNNASNILTNIVEAGYVFAGVATPTTNPGVPDAKVFYIANGKGTYNNFGGLEVTEDEVVILYYDTVWYKASTGIASLDRLITIADEEDITRNVDGKLQFKDRAGGDGMGYVILRKDKTFAEQVAQANTIYEIRYNFDLGGEDVDIPENCVLQFNGGMLRNGTLKVSNAKLDSELKKIFDNITFNGKFFNGEIYPEWVGAVGDGTTDDYVALQNCVNICKENSAKLLLSRKYMISHQLEYSAEDGSKYNPLVIVGNGVSSSGLIFTGEIGIYIQRGVNCQFDSFSIYGVNKNQGVGLKIGDVGTNYVVRSYFSNLYITNCQQCIYCFGWLNQFTNINARFATNGILDKSTASVYNNIIIEQCYHGITTSGIVSINGGTIEECIEGLEIKGGHITLNSVYFEGNSPNDGTIDYEIDPIEQKYIVGYHVKAGYSDRCSIVFNTCTFHWSVSNPKYEHSRIYLDSVNNVLFNACTICDVYTTENTGNVKFSNAINEYGKFSESPYIAFGSVSKKEGVSNNCFLEVLDFSDLIRVVDNKIFPTSDYYHYFPITQDSSVYLRLDPVVYYKNTYEKNRRLLIGRKSGGINRLYIAISIKDVFLKRYSGKISVEFDIRFIRDISVKMTYNPHLSCSNGGETIYSEVTKTNSIRQDLGNSVKTFATTLNLDEIRAKAINAGKDPSNNIYTVDPFVELLSAPEYIENEIEKCRIEILRIGIYEGVYKNNHGSTADINKREYEECGCLVPEVLFLPNEKEIESLRGKSAIYNIDDNLIGVKGTSLRRLQKISVGNRPENPVVGFQHFDNNNKPIWWTGSKWVDATGADV